MSDIRGWASPYWTGTGHAVRYVCAICASWLDTSDELAEHWRAEHPQERGDGVNGADVKARVMEALAYEGNLAHDAKAALSDCVVLTREEAERVASRVQSGFGCRTYPMQDGQEAERDYYKALAFLTPERDDADA